MVLTLHKRNFIVDRELYLDMTLYSLSDKARRGEEPCCIPYIYRAIKSVVSHMARSTDAEAALSEY